MDETKVRFRACSDAKRAAIVATRRATSLRRLSQVVKCHECKIVWKRLNNAQREQIKRLFVEAKWFYNHVLDLHRNGTELSKINTADIKSVSRMDRDGNRIATELTTLNAQQKQAIVARMSDNERTIATLVRKGLQSHGELHFISECTAIPLKQYGVTYRFKSANKVRIGGIRGDVLVRTGGQFDGVDEYANANLVHKPDGYYLKVTCYIDRAHYKEPERNGKEIGLDLGIKTTITTSEGEKIDVCVEESERLKRLQRELSRRQMGSDNRWRTILKIRRESKIANRKEDKANKIVSRLKRYSTVVMQDEMVANWHRGLFGKQVQHSCLGRVKAKLMRLPQTVVLARGIPTTKWCPECGTVNQYVTLGDRVYRCGCGYEMDRDVHSARNMVTIKNLVFGEESVPTEHREVTLTEFVSSTAGGVACGKHGRRSEKMPCL